MWWPERIYLKIRSKSEEVALGLGTCPVSRITMSPLEGGAGATAPVSSGRLWDPVSSSQTVVPRPAGPRRAWGGLCIRAVAST